MSNPDLKPETSRQFSLGIVVETVRHLNVSADQWNIRKTAVVSDLPGTAPPFSNQCDDILSTCDSTDTAHAGAASAPAP